MIGLVGKLALGGAVKSIGLPLIAVVGFTLLMSVKSCLHNVEDAFAAKHENARLIEANQQSHATRQSLREVHAAVVAEKERLEEDDVKHRRELDNLKARLSAARAEIDKKELKTCEQCLLDWQSFQSSQ